MRLKDVAAMMMLGGCTVAACAQMEMQMPKGAPVGSTVTIAKALDEPLALFEYQAVAAAKAMPADKYNFAPMSASIAGSKFDGVRTFLQEVVHVTEANYYFYSVVGGPKPDPALRAKLEAIKTKDEAVAALVESFAYAHKAVATVTLENGFVAIKAVDGQDTRTSLAAFAVAHGYDHYGQMVEYLRMSGVVPPGSK